MRPALALAIALSLSGCGTVFDPAPYSPNTDKAVISSGEGSSAIDMLQFKTPEQAAVKLQALAQGYAGERDDILRQQLIFDLPMIGLVRGDHHQPDLPRRDGYHHRPRPRRCRCGGPAHLFRAPDEGDGL